jgi:hypothetical protein
MQKIYTVTGYFCAYESNKFGRGKVKKIFKNTQCNLIFLPCRDNSVQLEIYHLLRTFVHNIQGRIQQTTYFDLLNHHQPLIKPYPANVEKLVSSQ